MAKQGKKAEAPAKTGKPVKGHEKKQSPPKEAKPEGKPNAAPQDKAKAKPAKKSRKVLVKGTAEVVAMRTKALSKNGHPVFRGRFGKRSIRKKANPKWDKWRFPRGLDVNHELSEGFNPRAGYGTAAEIRHLHPSGYQEFMVRTVNDLGKVPKNHAVRVVAGLGRRKKMLLVDKAIENGIKVLNP